MQKCGCSYKRTTLGIFVVNECVLHLDCISIKVLVVILYHRLHNIIIVKNWIKGTWGHQCRGSVIPGEEERRVYKGVQGNDRG